MAKIKNTDIADKDAFADLRKSAESTVAVLKEMETQLKNNLVTQKNFAKGLKANNVDDINKLAKAQNEVKKSVDGLNAVERERLKLEETLNKLNSDKIQQNEELKVLIADQRKTNRELAKDTLNLGNEYQKLTRQTNKAQAEFKRLAAKFGDNSKQAKAAKIEFDKLDSRLQKINLTAKDGKRTIGLYGTAFDRLGGTLRTGLGAIGITAGITGVAAVVSNIVGIFKDFEQANSKLKSVLGANAEEMANLKTQAIDLGAASAYTSTQVTELQTEFAKLGFPTKDILNMTASTLAAASAMGSELGEQAALTGATIKAFGLKSRDAARVNDVLALSTSRSALDFSKLSASMSTIAPVASKLGFGLEDTVALLGNLSDSGFDASSAATATRNIFLKLADSSSKLGKRLKEPVKDLPSLIRGLKQLKQEGIDLGGALELTDDRSVAAFSTFLSGTDSLEKLSAELNNANGAAQRMADTMLDNLAGDIEAAGGAWEGFILGLENGDGIIARVMRRATQGVTTLLNKLTEANKKFNEIVNEDVKKKTDERITFALKDIKTEEEKQKKLQELRILAKKDIEAVLKEEQKARFSLASAITKQAAASSTLDDSLGDLKNKKGVQLLQEIDKQFAKTLKGFADKGETKAMKSLFNSTLEVGDANTKLGLKMKQRLEAEALLVKIDEELTASTKEVNEETTKSTVLTDDQKRAIEARNKALADYRKQLEDVQNRLIKNDVDRQVQQTETDFKRRIDEIKGNGKVETELRKNLAIERNRIIDKIIKDAADKERESEEKKQKELEKFRKYQSEYELEQEKKNDNDRYEIEKKDEEEAARKRAELRERTLSVIEALEQKYFDEQNKRADKQLSDAEKREERLQELADRGIQDASDSLARNQKDQAEAVKKKEELAQKEKNFELALAVFKSFNAELEKGATTGEALTKALVSTSVLTAAASSLPVFFEGTEDTGNGGNIDGKGGFLSVLHPNERVVPKAINEKLGGITNDELGELAENGLLSYALNSQQMGVSYSKDSKITKELEKLQNLNKGIIKAIENRPLDKGWEVDELRKLVTHSVQRGSTTIKTNIKL